MARRNASAPWAAPLLTALSLLGAALTAYLTVVKLTGGSAACPTQGCETVLNSRYGDVVEGFPLALLGLGAYLLVAALVAALAILPQRISDEADRAAWQGRVWTALFWLTTAMASMGGYLIFVLVTDLRVLCLYCIASAALSWGLWLATVFGRPWEDWGKLSFDGIVIALVVGFGAIALNGTSPDLATARPNLGDYGGAGGYGGAAIATVSTPDNIALAQYLSHSGAKMYGAYWCSHCHDQKSLFGSAALAELPYIECDSKGINPQPDQCKAANVEGYPTWVINGEVMSGTQGLADLADASGYAGSRNFSPAP
ncbi:MAG: vitamin K epoxide reductase family protein [Synechococcales cyanobacterium RM1_1_8]|nr:vitamin K epoxide reductase family protein [Synechococcales cyanobacterium RM1_1_8]